MVRYLASLGNLPNLTTLSLDNNSLSGEISDSLGNLSNLTTLNLNNNSLSGEIPNSLGNLPNLTTLNLDNNSLSGEIPNSLGNLSNLTTLSLDNNSLSGEIPNSLGNLPNLTTLNLDNNSLSGEIPNSLGNLSNLTTLSLDNNGLSGPIPNELKTLNAIQIFRLYDNAFLPDDLALFAAGYGTNTNGWRGADHTFDSFALSPQNPAHPEGDTLLFGQIVSNPYITGLVYNENAYDAEYRFTPEEGNPIIQIGNAQLDNPTIDTYTLQTTLSSPDYGDGANELVFTTEVVVLFNLLDVLDGNNKPINQISCEIMAENFTDDRDLLCYQYLSFDNSSRSIVNNWDFSAPVNTNWTGISDINSSGRIVDISLSSYGLGGTIAPELGGLLSLEILLLDNNNLSGEIPNSLGSLPNLTNLDLSNNTLSGEIPNSLGSLLNLTTLNLNNNTLSGEIPSALGNLSSLTHLYLSNNNFDGSIPSTFGDLFSLTHLHLSNNTLSGEIPNIWKTFMFDELRIDSNAFLPDDLSEFVTGYGTDDNDWSTNNGIFGLLLVSPQSPQHPSGDTLYYGLFPYIRGIAYNGVDYSAEYRFARVGGTPIVQMEDAQLNNPEEGTYHITTTLNRDDAAYGLGANELVFNSEVVVLNAGSDMVLDANNKPINRASCDVLAGTFLDDDDRVPLCYQYVAIDSLSRPIISNWNFSAPISNWTGIGIDNNGRVVSINLGNRDISGTLAPELGDLSNLRNLFLNDNNLSGSIPESLGNLPNFTGLITFSRNNLSGSIPSSLGNLSNLQELWLGDNNLSGSIPSSLGNLSKLTMLRLNDNNLSGQIPESLGNLSKLTMLRLNDNNLSGQIPSSLGNLSKLTDLTFSRNNLSGEIPSSLGNLSNLIELWLVDNNLSGSIPSSLGNLSKLRILRLHDNNLSGSIPSSLGNLSNLIELWLHNNNLSGEIPSSLGNLPSLVLLYLNNNNLSGEIPLNLENLLNAHTIYLNDNNLSGSIPPGFKALRASRFLVRFQIANNAFSPNDMATFISGYGTNDNFWRGRTFNTFTASPQNPAHPAGDTLYHGPLIPFNGLVYSQNDYSAEYTFTLDGGAVDGSDTTIVQMGNAQLDNPAEGTYRLTTTLRRADSTYGSGANELIFNSQVTVTNIDEEMADILDANNKPINRVSCDQMAEVVFDDRVPLCYQYLAIDSSSRSVVSNWDFSDPIEDWTDIVIDNDDRVTSVNFGNRNISGTLAPELSDLSKVFVLAINNNNFRGEIPSSLGNLSKLQFDE